MNADETWKAIPGFPGYEVSTLGRARTWRRPGMGHTKLRSTPALLAGSRTWANGSYTALTLRPDDGKPQKITLHRAVLMTFVGPRPEGLEIRHLNGDPSDNRLENLAYGTRSENILDQVRHGTHARARQTACVNGHPFDDENTIVTSQGRRCRTCDRAAKLKHSPPKPRALGPINVVHGTHAGYARGCRCAECTEVKRQYNAQYHREVRRARQAGAA